MPYPHEHALVKRYIAMRVILVVGILLRQFFKNQMIFHNRYKSTHITPNTPNGTITFMKKFHNGLLNTLIPSRSIHFPRHHIPKLFIKPPVTSLILFLPRYSLHPFRTRSSAKMMTPHTNKTNPTTIPPSKGADGVIVTEE